MKHLGPLLLICSIFACSSEDLETANFGSDYFHNPYQVSNLSQNEVDLYIANRSFSGKDRFPFKDKYRVVSSMNLNQRVRISHEHNPERHIIIGVEAPFSANQIRDQLTHKVSNDTHYHIIVLPTGNGVSHRLIESNDDTQEGMISVRILATEANLEVFYRQQTHQLIPGKVTEHVRLDGCLGSLSLNGLELDLCDADFGRAYILVVNAEGILGMIPESF